MPTALTRLPKHHAADASDRVTTLDAHSGLITLFARVPDPGKHMEVIT